MNSRRFFFVLLSALVLSFCAAFIANAQTEAEVRAHYTKMEQMIPMRDGVKLFTSIYLPKDKSHKYPIMFDRTPYTVAPYGKDKFRASLGPNDLFVREGYIFVYQDVRGCWMS